MHRIDLLVLSAAAGGLQFLSYEPTGWWPAAWIGLALLFVALLRCSTWRFSLLVGFAWGTSTALFSLPWIGSFVGYGPYVALSAVLGLLAMPAAWAMWFVGNSGLPTWLRLPGMAALVAAGEALLQRWPFGGFPWLRVAWGQVDGPLAPAVALGGTALVSFLAALAAAGLVALLSRRFLTGLGLVAVALLVGSALPMLQPLPEAAPEAQTRVAVIQGNVPRLGLEFNAQRRAVLQNHADATGELARRVRAGEEQQPDVVIWPENSSDVSPFRDSEAARIIDSAAANIAAPIVVGTFTYDNGTQNTMVVWDPALGPTERHEKIYLQPFGETMPFRDLLRHVSDMVDRAGNMTPGSGDGVVATGEGTPFLKPVKLGLATCYEVVFDGAYRNAVRNGATMLATPTNNATFGFTDMTYQQLAMSRMRAMEFQRSTFVAATSGVSAIIDAHGAVGKQSKIFEQKVLTATLPQYSHMTLAARFGAWIEGGIVAFGIVCLVGALVGALRGASGGAAGDPARRRRNTHL
nr:apolipoprotein N-acyltransferase [Corynebacterium lactis]